MSAIWGCIDLSGSPIEKGIPDKMTGCTTKYKIDRTNHMLDKNVYMACGLQYITKESYDEKLPYVEDGVYFTADCVLDDRENLIKKLGDGVSEDTPDGMLLYRAFRKWGEAFSDHIIGMFSFAVYDSNNGEFHLYTDHTSYRCIHYYTRGSRIFFATLTSCITDLFTDIKLCEKWMYACQATVFSLEYLYEGLSPFEGIYIIPYGSGISARLSGKEIEIEKKRYWDPINEIDADKKFDDEKYRKEFLSTHIATVKDAIRTDGEVGILLSGGLDSTSVASVAATLLEKDGKNIYSFTSIPLKEFRESKEKRSPRLVHDESAAVLTLSRKYPNIKPEFLACEGESPWTYIETWNDFMEHPGKSYLNHVWIHDAYKMAKDKKCKVVMQGAWGNRTISYGSMENTAYKDIVSGHPLKGINELMGYAKKMHFSRKRYFKHFVRISREVNKKPDFEGYFDTDNLKEKVFETYDVKQEWINVLNLGGKTIKSDLEKKYFIVSPWFFQLMGVICTKYGLYHGIIVRDPTSDKRMIELCLRMPYQCFASGGHERRLVREYLKEYVPDEIRLDALRRGIQSGDAKIRFEKYLFPDGKMPWEKVTDKIEKYYYMDKAIKQLKEESGKYLDWQVKVISCSLFLEKYDR